MFMIGSDYCTNWVANHVNKDELKPYRHHRIKLSVQSVCLPWGYRVVVPSHGRSLTTWRTHDPYEEFGMQNTLVAQT